MEKLYKRDSGGRGEDRSFDQGTEVNEGLD